MATISKSITETLAAQGEGKEPSVTHKLSAGLGNAYVITACKLTVQIAWSNTSGYLTVNGERIRVGSGTQSVTKSFDMGIV